MVEHISITCDIDDPVNIVDIARRAKPEWPTEEIKTERLVGGYSNKMIRCFRESAPDDTVLIRIYGRNLYGLVDRSAERRRMITMHAAGIGPELYFSFENGLCYQFTPGKCVNTENISDEKISKLVATAMARSHSVQSDPLPGSKENAKHYLFTMLWRMLDVVPDSYQDSAKNKLYKEAIASKSILEKEVSLLQSYLAGISSPIVFCHNDLALSNIIYNDAQGKVSFIDYEFGSLNYEAFEIANHFNEFAGIENIDYIRFPDKIFQMMWLKTYLEAKAQLEGKTAGVSTADVEELYIVVNKFTLASHLFWILWSLIQEESNDGIPFLEYSLIRLQEYYKRKEEVLAL